MHIKPSALHLCWLLAAVCRLPACNTACSADERAQLEALRNQLLGPGGQQPLAAASQALRAPLPLGLTLAEQQLLEAYADKVAAWGWRWQPGTASSGGGSGPEGPQLTHAPLLWGTALSATDLKVRAASRSSCCSSQAARGRRRTGQGWWLLPRLSLRTLTECGLPACTCPAALPLPPAALPAPPGQRLRCRWAASWGGAGAQLQGLPQRSHVWRQAGAGAGGLASFAQLALPCFAAEIAYCALDGRQEQHD